MKFADIFYILSVTSCIHVCPNLKIICSTGAMSAAQCKHYYLAVCLVDNSEKLFQVCFWSIMMSDIGGCIGPRVEIIFEILKNTADLIIWPHWKLSVHQQNIILLL